MAGISTFLWLLIFFAGGAEAQDADQKRPEDNTDAPKIGRVEVEVPGLAGEELPGGCAICLVPAEGTDDRLRHTMPYGLRPYLVREGSSPLNWEVPVGAYRVEWRTSRSTSGGRPQGVGLKQHLADVTIEAGECVRVSAEGELPSLGEIEVTVQLEGREQEGIIVRAIASQATNPDVSVRRRIGVTNAYGRVTLYAVEPGVWRLVATPGVDEGRLLGPRGLKVCEGGRVTAKIEGTLVLGTIQVLASETRQPLAGQWLAAMNSQGIFAIRRTDEHGFFTYALPLGEVEFTRTWDKRYRIPPYPKSRFAKVQWGPEGPDQRVIMLRK